MAPQQGIALSLTQSEIWAALAFGISFFARLNQPEGALRAAFWRRLLYGHSPISLTSSSADAWLRELQGDFLRLVVKIANLNFFPPGRIALARRAKAASFF